MNGWYRKNEGLVWFATILATVMAYAYTTFATVSYVDKKHEDVLSVLSRMELDLKDTRDKVYELNGEVPHNK